MRKEKLKNTTDLRGGPLFVQKPEQVLFVIDSEQKITYMNTEAEVLTGWNLISAVNTSFKEVCPFPDVLLKIKDCLTDSALSKSESVSHSTVSLGSATAKLTLTMLKDHKGKHNGFVIVLQQEPELESLLSSEPDLHQEIKALKAELQQKELHYIGQLKAMQEEMERFTYSVSHDLKAPLRIISGFSKILMEDFAILLNPEGRQLLKDIRENVQKLESLMTDILAYSRVSTHNLEFLSIDMVSLAHSVYHELVKEHGNRKIELRIGKMPHVTSDPVLVRQIWKNLLDNALKFSSKKTNPVVEIGCIKEGKENLFFVRDNGEGFDMKYLHKVFNVFERLHSSEDFKGNGMGLAIVKRILDRLNGKIKGQSTGNEGAAFYFTLSSTLE